MAATARRVEDPEVPRILLGPRLERLTRSTDQILATVSERGPGVAHLVPDPAECVVGEELNHIPWRKELVANGQLATVSWGLALAAHLGPLVAGVEVLVDPADRLVLAPHVGECTLVEDGEQRL